MTQNFTPNVYDVMFNKRVGVFYHNFKNSLIIHEQITQS